jgi:hypothetical protein
MHVAGSSIDRVFNQPIAPARKFRGTIDAALTLAFGSVCAFGLTLGPAPMNTVALSAPASSSAVGNVDPEQGTVLAPGDVDGAGTDSTGDEVPGASFRPRLPASSENTEPASVAPSAEASAPAQPAPAPNHPLGKQPPPQAQQPQVQQPQHGPLATPPENAAGPQFKVQSTALSVVENFRVASGLGAFVAAADCAQPVVHAVVKVTPSHSLPPGLSTKSLAPDPAFATVGTGPGAGAVTVFRCD